MLNYNRNIIDRFIIVFISFFGFISCEEILFESKLSDENIVIISPENNTKIFTKAVRFEWQEVPTASRYQIQLATPTFENSEATIFDRIVDTTFVIDTLRQLAKYEWRVRGLSNRETTPYSVAAIELISNPAFEFRTVNLIAPAGNSISNVAETTLVWDSVEEADFYEVEIENQASEIVHTENVEGTSLLIVLPEGEITWRIRAVNDNGQTAFAERSIIIDTQSPEQPMLVSPENETTIAVTDLQFTWAREEVAGSREIDSIFIFSDLEQMVLIDKQEVESPFETDLEAGNYFWKLQAFDEAGNLSEESDLFSFTLN